MTENIKLYLATPVHSDVSMHYTQSVVRLQTECYKKGIEFTLELMKSSLVTQGRNLCVSHFLNSDATHLLFIDSDILFYPQSIFEMLRADVNLISIPYPMKQIHWDKVFNKIEDLPNMTELQKNTSGNKFPVKIKDEESDIKCVDGLIELNFAPTGCMLLKRQVFDKMIQKYPKKIIKQETEIDGETIIKPNLYNFFDTYYDEKEQRYYGEDFAFSRLWRNIGGTCYALITEYITHVGEYQYTGRLIDEMVAVGIDVSKKKE